MIGDLSRKYESSGDPGCISSGYGDAGGKSYGAYQFAINSGIPQKFVQWLINSGHEFGKVLAMWEPGSRQFDVAWLKLAKDYPQEFLQLQHAFIEAFYFTPAIENLWAIGFRVLERSTALQQVLWSRAVQYEPKWMVDLFQEAANLAGEDLLSISDKNLIYYIYEVNLTNPEWTAGSPDLRPGLFARFEHERQDALEMLGGT